MALQCHEDTAGDMAQSIGRIGTQCLGEPCAISELLVCLKHLQQQAILRWFLQQFLVILIILSNESLTT